MSEYVVALETMGSFHGLALEPTDLAEAREFVADPPECWAPRPQDDLVIYELTRVER